MKMKTEEEEKPGFGCIQSDDRKHCLRISSRSTSNTNATDSHSPLDSSADLLPIAVWSAEIWTSDKKHKDVSLSSDVLTLFFFFFQNAVRFFEMLFYHVFHGAYVRQKAFREEEKNNTRWSQLIIQLGSFQIFI